MKPTELAITMACLPDRYNGGDGWLCADEVRGRLKLLGFDCSIQQVAAWLARMARTDAPWVERDDRQWVPMAYYRVTHFGRNDIDNQFQSLRPVTPWLPTYREAWAEKRAA